MQNINFYDRSLRLKRDWFSGSMALAAVGGSAAVVAAAWLVLHLDARALQAPVHAAGATLEAEQAPMQALARKLSTQNTDAMLEKKLLDLQRTLAQRQATLQLLRDDGLRHNAGHAGVLQALARQSVDGLWLTRVTLDGGDLTLSGRSLRADLIPVYVGRLSAEPALLGRSFRALDIQRPDARAGTPAAAAEAASAPRRAPYVEFLLAGASQRPGTAGAADAAAGALR